MNDYRPELERTYQNRIVKLFREELDYYYIVNLQKKETNSPILEDRLRKFLSRDGVKYSKSQIDEAVRTVKEKSRLASLGDGNLLQTNNDFYEILISHISIQPAANKPHENIYLFDFENPYANDFAIAEEVSYTDKLTGENSRPDLVIYVNGIALAVIELKRSTVPLDEGIKQNLSNEKRLIPSFFTTVQFTVAASDKNGFKYATILTSKDFWCAWKRDDHKIGEPLSDTDSFKLFFDKKTFFELFRYGVIYDGGRKKVMRPHQYYALKAAMPRLRANASGVIWHSQGSGKSLTMVWITRYIRQNFQDPLVLIITDRTELDQQIHNTFLNTKEPSYRAKSSDDLLDALSSGTKWLICSLIHKFGRHIDPTTGKEVIGDDDAPIPLEIYLKELVNSVKNYNGKFSPKGTNKFVFVDECHRTQGGKLHEAMRMIMGEDVMFIGFTGTPLLRDDKAKGGYEKYTKLKNASEHRFGPFIHKYLNREAVDDKVILDLRYEARDVEQCIRDRDVLDKKFEEISAGHPEENREILKKRWATLEKVYSSKERIERIAYSILDDMGKYPLDQGWCNAMLVAGNIYSAYRYYKFFQETCDNHLLKNKCAVVTSYVPSSDDIRKSDDGNDANYNESQFKYDTAKLSYKNMGVNNADKYEAKVKNSFVNSPAQMKLLIVVDKLLTGFDAPSATYLYIDKEMRDHNLFQAICRVNRLGTNIKVSDDHFIISHKEDGRIVDFKNLFNKIADAMVNFNDPQGGLGGYDREDIDELLNDFIAKGKKRLEKARDAYESVQSEWESRGLKGAEEVAGFYAPNFVVDEADEVKTKRMDFYKITQNLVTAYSNMADYMIRAKFTSDEIKTIRSLVSEAALIQARVRQKSGEDFDPKGYDPQMRELLDRFISAEEAKNIIPATADFTFLDLLISASDTDDVAQTAVKKAGSRKAAAEKIVAKARDVINDWRKTDKALALSFAEQLQKIIDQIKDKETTMEEIKRLIELLKSMKGKGKYPDGIDSKFAQSLWNNRKEWSNCKDDEEVKSYIKIIEEHFANCVYADWEDQSKPAYKDCVNKLKQKLKNFTGEQLIEIHKIAANNNVNKD